MPCSVQLRAATPYKRLNSGSPRKSLRGLQDAGHSELDERDPLPAACRHFCRALQTQEFGFPLHVRRSRHPKAASDRRSAHASLSSRSSNCTSSYRRELPSPGRDRAAARNPSITPPMMMEGEGIRVFAACAVRGLAPRILTPRLPAPLTSVAAGSQGHKLARGAEIRVVQQESSPTILLRGGAVAGGGDLLGTPASVF